MPPRGNQLAYEAPTREEIAAFASYISQAEGPRSGSPMDHWLQAEAQLIATRKFEAGLRISPGTLRN